jgi:hypothetical protein
MTATRDPDGILRAWLDLMPDEAPDRLFDAVLDQIDQTPQVRRARLAGQWRFPQMPRMVLAGAVAVLAIVVGAIALVPRSNLGAGGSPGPSSSARVEPSGAGSPRPAAPVPEALRHRWMGGISPLVTAGAGTSILFGAGSLALSQSNANDVVYLSADAALPSPGQLRLTTAGSSGGCATDALGTYDFILSPSGRVLSLNAADDPCADRSASLAGTWWRMDCKDPNDNCLGSIDPGTYASQFINFGRSGTNWQARFGAIRYAAGEGWANDADWPSRFSLTPQAAYDRWTQERGAPSGIDVLADISAAATTKPCASTAAPGVDRTPDAIIASIRDTTGLTVSDSAAITVDGHRGAWVDLAVDDAKLKPCDGERIVEFLVSAGEGQAIASGERARLIVLTDGPAPLAIVIRAPAADFSGLVLPAMRIVKSMQFG